jgi:two-component system, OmpR family, sensor histidine kinase MprB
LPGCGFDEGGQHATPNWAALSARASFTPVDLADVVDAALDRVRIRAPGLTFTAALEPATVLGRANELERMVVNVLDNAA